MEDLAPIVLFVYNRPAHARETLEHLRSCSLADRSQLYVFSDGPKSGDTSGVVDQVRALIEDISGFAQVTVVQNESNVGLAESIIRGLNQVFKSHDRVIVLEDDMHPGVHYLEYMNQALKRYADDQRVYAISGYAYDLPFLGARGSYFLPTSSNQAWGTWKEIWESVDFHPDDFDRLAKDRRLRWRFDVHGALDYSSRLIDATAGERARSWAIRFRWHQFKNKGLTLFPSRNLVRNSGWDGSGTNCVSENPYGEDIENLDFRETKFPMRVGFLKRDYLRLVLFLYSVRVREYVRVRLPGYSPKPAAGEEARLGGRGASSSGQSLSSGGQETSPGEEESRHG